MSYQVLARKWRPRTFTEVVGQEHVTRALCNAIQLGRLHHAYLFTGTRGVGKTTLARILAAALNCESGVVVEPCGKCQSCKEIRSGRFIDLIEVDAASRSGVEDMRDLLDTVQYAAAAGRFKIYLVDEVHMLSNSSFNALLKTLEEPPSHAKFFFATTDPQKIPATVLSRCLQFNLIRLSHERIADYLANRLTTEDVRYENEALLELAVAADGSMRDALSLLDQALAYGAGELSQEVVENTLGITARANLPRLVRALVAGDSQAIFSEIGEMHRSAADFSAALDDLLSLFHELAVQQVLPETTPSHRFPLKEIVALSRSVSANDVQLYYQIAVKSRQDMLFLSDQRSVFEMALLRMLCFRPLFAEVTVSAGTQQESFAAHSGSETIVSRGNRAGDAVASAPVHGQAVSQETSGCPASVRQESNVETSAQDRDATTRPPDLSPRFPTRQEDDVATSAQDRDATTRPPDLSPRFPTRQEDDVETSVPARDATIRPGLSPRPSLQRRDDVATSAQGRDATTRPGLSPRPPLQRRDDVATPAQDRDATIRPGLSPRPPLQGRDDVAISAQDRDATIRPGTSPSPPTRQEDDVETSVPARDATIRPGLSPRPPLQRRDDVATSAPDRDATTRPGLSPRPSLQGRDDVATSAQDRGATTRPGLSPRPSLQRRDNVAISAQDRDATTRPGLSLKSPLQRRDDVATSAQDRDATTRPPDLSPRFPTRQEDDVATSAPDQERTTRPGLSPRPPMQRRDDVATPAQDRDATIRPGTSPKSPIRQEGDKGASDEIWSLVGKDVEYWRAFADKMALTGGARELCLNSVFQVRNEDAVVILVRKENRGLVADRMFGQLRAALQKCYGPSLKVEWEVSDAHGETPGKQEQLALSRQQKMVRDGVMSHPFVETLRRDFDATVVESSIRSHNAGKPKIPGI